MAENKELHSKLEWKVNVPDGTSEILVPESGPMQRLCRGIHGVIVGFLMKIRRFIMKAYNLGVNEPKKFIHCLKVGTALSLVSLFYYMRPLYKGVGGNAMWAVMTVVVVFEYTIGSTLYKCVNRATGTMLAGSLGFGVHWVASQCGEKYEPVILEISVFLVAAAATFSRFIPSVKARFDYGAMIFILTFCLVSVSGYRVDELFEMAHNRLLTVAIGATICILISILICPVWAGRELHCLIIRNLEKLADSLDGCVVDYFKDEGVANFRNEDSGQKNLGYKCVLNSKAAEDSMANFARWEPAHGNFNFRHPWKQYLKIGAATRSCAYCVETLNGCINSDIQAPESLKKHFRDVCMRLSSYSSNVIKELAIIMKTMTKSSKIYLSIEEMNFAVQELQSAIKALPNQLVLPMLEASDDGSSKGETIKPTDNVSVFEILPLATAASLLVEIAARIEGIVHEVDELANQAEFNLPRTKKSKEMQPTTTDNQDQATINTLQIV